MTNSQRKDWLYANLERDSFNPGSAARNVAKHGAARIIEVMGPTIWPDSYGQTPFDDTYLLASKTVRGEI